MSDVSGARWNLDTVIAEEKREYEMEMCGKRKRIYWSPMTHQVRIQRWYCHYRGCPTCDEIRAKKYWRRLIAAKEMYGELSVFDVEEEDRPHFMRRLNYLHLEYLSLPQEGGLTRFIVPTGGDIVLRTYGEAPRRIFKARPFRVSFKTFAEWADTPLNRKISGTLGRLPPAEVAKAFKLRIEGFATTAPMEAVREVAEEVIRSRLVEFPGGDAFIEDETGPEAAEEVASALQARGYEVKPTTVMILVSREDLLSLPLGSIKKLPYEFDPLEEP